MTQVPSSYHFSRKYSSLERFINYFYQVDSTYDYAPKSILFIGVGDGLVPHLLRQNDGCQVTTLDFDAGLKPDVVGDIRSLPFPDKSFDLVCIFEVLEHVPYDEMLVALGELARVAKSGVVVSVPHRRIGFEIVIKIPLIRSLLKRGFLRAAIRIPVRFPGFAISKQHYWEIDGVTTKLSAFRRALREHFTITGEATPVLDLYRRFFYLRVR